MATPKNISMEDFQKWSIPENTTTDKPVDKPVDTFGWL
jgi:hypothetical protein